MLQKKVLSAIGEHGDASIVWFTINQFKFQYPHSLNIKSTPYIKQEPNYKVNTNSQLPLSFYYEKNKNNELDKKDFSILKHIVEDSSIYNYVSFKSWLHSFDEIIYAMDADYTGVRGFKLSVQFFLQMTLKEFLTAYNVSGMHTAALDNLSLNNSFKTRKTPNEHQFFQAAEHHYACKDYFEYNFNINSLVIINHLYSKLNIPQELFTKNMFQTLYLINDEEHLDCQDLIYKMQQRNIGSAASRGAIVEKLVNNLKLIDISNDKIQLSKSGKDLKSYLHKKMNDPYLNRRVDEWINNLTYEEFKEKTDRYIQTIFKKQKTRAQRS